MSVAGTWQLTIVTPIGKQVVVLELRERDGGIEGNATGDAETTPLLEPVLNGDRLTWTQVITKPMRLTLKFDVSIEGNALSGTATAGMLPASNVIGHKVT